MAHKHCMLNTEGYKHPRNTQYLLLSHCNNGCRKASLCYVTRTGHVLLLFHFNIRGHSTSGWFYLRSSVSSFSPRRYGFDPTAAYIHFMANNLSLGQQYVSFASFFVIPLAFHIHFPTIMWI